MTARIRSVCIAAIFAAASATVLNAAQTSFSRIVVFGTSLSDPGNAFALGAGQNTPPAYDLDTFLVPGAPYARGGHHFSNGATWIEQYAQSRGLAGSVRGAFVSSDPGATNFAIGGARARNFGVTNLSVQVGAFLQRVGGMAPSDALYVVEMGPNDIRDAIAAYAANDIAGGNAILQEAIGAIETSVGMLYGAGARQFLIWRAPDIGLTPAVLMVGNQAFSDLATSLSFQFNAGLDTAVSGLSGLPGITIDRLDSFTILHAVDTDPGAFGLTNVTSACVTPNIPPFVCSQPDDYLFWDGIHPTAAGHAILAQQAASVLKQ